MAKTNFRPGSKWGQSGTSIYNLNTGNVGIGTTAPTNTLHVVGDASGSTVARFEQSNPSSFSNISIANTAPADNNNIAGIALNLNTDTSSRAVFRIDSTFNTITDASRNSLIQFKSSNAGSFVTAMAINGSNVGIGTTAPQGKLNVQSASSGSTVSTNADELVVEGSGSTGISILTANSQTGSLYFGTAADSIEGILQWDDPTTQLVLGTHTSGGILQFRTGNNNDAMRIDGVGNVGIGTTNPSNKLHVQRNSSGRAWSSDSNDIFIMENNVATSFDFITGNTTSAFLLFSDTDARARGWIQYNHSDDSLNFRTAGTSNRLVISNTGNVGVNQASPTSKLFVTGSDSTVPALSVKAASNTPTGDVFEVQNASGAAVLASRYITGTASGTLGLYVGGNIAVGGTALVAHALIQASANATDPTTNTFGVNASRTVSVTSSNSNPVTGGSFNISTAGQNFALTGQLTGGSFSIQNGNINTVSNAKGGNFLLYNTGAGTITNGYAGYFLIQNLNASGVITNAYGAYISLNVNVNSGTLTNTYGLYIDDMTHGTQTNQAYGIYVADANARNYIADKVGIGQTSPTAVLHLKAGTSSANTAPLKLTSGTNLATAEAGAFEYDGTNLYFTPSGTTRRTVAYLPTSPPDYTVTNGTEDRTFDADATTTEELADVLSTLIADLTAQGVLQ